MRLLTDRSWLRDEDWVTQNATIYRAAWYLTCYEMPASQGADVQTAVRDLPWGARAVLQSRPWTALPPDVEKGAVRPRCLVLSRADATVLVKAFGGDIAVGTANVFPTGLPEPATPYSVHALTPDGTSGAHGD